MQVLYSDVGDTLYERAGYRLPAFVPTQAQFLLLPQVPAVTKETAGTQAAQSEHTEEVTEPAATELSESHRRLVEAASTTTPILRGDVPREVGQMLRGLVDEKAKEAAEDRTILVLPSADQIEWLLEREFCCCEQMGIPPLPQAGARKGETFAIWTMDVSKTAQFVKILALHHPEGSSDDDLAAVAAAAVRVALNAGAYDGGVISWGLHGVSGRQPSSLRSPDKDALAAAGLLYKEAPRKTSLPMLAPICTDVEASMWTYVPQALWL